ncbi:MAG: TRAP transporter substrate-binding protein DctP [Deltaproteobacteria bacterium]|nr:MAG: TRAP transporter substrate-binding protein DctP [Deltaproteobacteria bacterium]
MKKILLSVIIILLTGNPVLGQKKPEYVMKLCAIAPEGTSWTDMGHQFADYIYEKSGGRLKVVWYLGGVMGDEPVAVKKVRLGQLQGGVFTVVGLQKIVPEVSILTLPNLFKSYDEVDYVLKKMTSPFSRMFEEKGFVFFDWVEIGFVYFFSKKPIHNLDEIKETKTFYWEGDFISQEMFETQGYKHPVPLELFEVLTGLHTGMVETFYSPYYACLALQWYQYAKYLNAAPLAYTAGGVVVTKEFFDGLPQDLKDIFLDASKIYFPKLTPVIRQDHEKTLEGFRKQGITVIEPTPEVEEQLEREAREIYTKLKDRYFPQWLLAGILNARARYRAGLVE